jgi:hypothetical protein
MTQGATGLLGDQASWVVDEDIIEPSTEITCLRI